ncbi:DNA-binding transcriptional LysR family regulator [Paenibacillus endophyticus]|uniref:DNA-binding transcriptional LysR family regulator n=1 Tax=Paenibacillus endophyticus TaxID=1294268 RepID=A0A7W5G9K7_9BACL|nr:LysR family transcriptional regulator [Paenibacillus endophyticus]MBB3151077.1 DNA-binding transcriptional LysR family regulator [Paenibacillus endophyticus]
MNKSLLQMIVAISETRSFTAAGEKMNMTQPAVSRAVTSLERELGVTLLIRDRRHGVALTPFGERIVRIFREILQGYDKIDQEIASEKGLETGYVRIGAFPVAASYFVPKLISHIKSLYPRIEFSIVEGTIIDVQDWLDNRQIDVGLLIPSDNATDSFPLYREGIYAVMRDDHPLNGKSLIRPEDLREEPMIICKAGYEPPVLKWFDSAGMAPRIEYILNNYRTALQMVLAGEGLAVMSELSLLDCPQGLTLKRLSPEAYRDIHIASAPVENCTIAVKMFIETAQKLFPFQTVHESLIKV